MLAKQEEFYQGYGKTYDLSCKKKPTGLTLASEAIIF